MHPAPRILDTHGHLPPFWGEAGIFFANLLGLFFGNEEETEMLAREVGCVDSYGGRLIPILDLLFKGSGNILVLEREPNPDLCRHFQEVLKLKLPELRILSHADYVNLGLCLACGETAQAIRLLGELPGHHPRLMDGYVTDSTLEAIARHTGRHTVSTAEGSRRGNNKYLLHRCLESAGLPVFDTILAENSAGVPRALQELAQRGYRRAVAKSQIGASGIGMLKLSTSGPWPDLPLPEYFFFEGPCLVQGWLETGQHGIREIYSPSLQMFLGEERIYFYDMTEQILCENSIHEGNLSPPPLLQNWPVLREELLRQSEVAGLWLHDQGYRGTASTDFLVAAREESSVPSVYVCEINARVTGATYPSMLARHFFPGGTWLMRNLELAEPLPGQELLDTLRRRGDLFDLTKPGGIIPVNFNLNAENKVTKGQFLCLAPTGEDCQRYLVRAQDELPLAWHFTRD